MATTNSSVLLTMDHFPSSVQLRLVPRLIPTAPHWELWRALQFRQVRSTFRPPPGQIPPSQIRGHGSLWGPATTTHSRSMQIDASAMDFRYGAYTHGPRRSMMGTR